MDRVELVREKVSQRFSKTLESDELGKKLEVVLWNHTLRTCQRDKIPMEWTAELNLDTFRERYTQKALALDLHNLRKNELLRTNLQNGSLGLKKFVAMTPWEMNPEFWAPIFERVAFKALRKQTTHDVENAPDGAFTCRCGSKKTTYYQLQTRASDEPMTTFIQCLSCSKRWKQ